MCAIRVDVYQTVNYVDRMVNDEAQQLAKRIIKANQDHTIRWLSEHSGIPYVTLKRNLEVTPEKFNVGQLVALAIALDLRPGTFLESSVTVAA